jgi:hypothetical protein
MNPALLDYGQAVAVEIDGDIRFGAIVRILKIESREGLSTNVEVNLYSPDGEKKIVTLNAECVLCPAVSYEMSSAISGLDAFKWANAESKRLNEEQQDLEHKRREAEDAAAKKAQESEA